VALLKGGLTQAGGRSTQSHTASLAGSGEIWRAVARQVNAVLVDDMQAMEDVLVGWQFDAIPRGPNVALVVGGGGLSVQGADDLQHLNLQLPELSEPTQETLGRFTPIAGSSVRNPVDTVTLWTGQGLTETLAAVARDEAIDSIVLQIGMGWGGSFDATAPAARNSGIVQELVAARRHLRAHRKPLLVVVPPIADPRGAPGQADLVDRAWRAGFPVFASIRAAGAALSPLLDWQSNRAG
jgi:acyl-CoA synthetase (NDP forming)